jgi:hypothetical protein
MKWIAIVVGMILATISLLGLLGSPLVNRSDSFVNKPGVYRNETPKHEGPATGQSWTQQESSSVSP